MTKHHEDCDVYRATLDAEGPYGDPSISPADYHCLSECEPSISIGSGRFSLGRNVSYKEIERALDTVAGLARYPMTSAELAALSLTISACEAMLRERKELE